MIDVAQILQNTSAGLGTLRIRFSIAALRPSVLPLRRVCGLRERLQEIEERW